MMHFDDSTATEFPDDPDLSSEDDEINITIMSHEVTYPS